jgi:hypothetical protein
MNGPYDKGFVPGKRFQPGVMSAGKARILSYMGAFESCLT